jgi:uncharacterized protein (TIGR02246 family)
MDRARRASGAGSAWLAAVSVTKIWRVEAVETLIAVQAIRDLVVTYAMAFDDHDWTRLGSLWTEDAAFVVGDQAFEGREAVMAFLSTCLPDDYDGKHMNPQTLVQLSDDGNSAVADTDVVWIPQNFQNTILARYHDDVVKEGNRWLFRRREEFPVQYRPGPPPMSGTAMTVSSATMLSDD